jgi:hypothetical protein
MPPSERAARDILAQLEATYQPTHRYVDATPSDYRHLDIRWYEKTTQRLATQGFRPLRDVEDKTITEAPGTVLSAIMVRVLVSRDGAVVSALYHPHIRRFWLRALLWLLRKLPGNVTDMETEFSDGSFVATSNAVAAAAIENGPMILAEFLSASTDSVAVFRRHEARVAEHLASRPGVTVRVVRDYRDALASQDRMNALKAAYRGEVGMITREELERVATMGGRAIVPDVHDEIARELQRRAG